MIDISNMDSFKKKTDENMYEYIWRLGLEKEDGSLYDEPWDNIADLINKELYGDDLDSYRSTATYRKPFQSAHTYYQNVFSKNITNDNSLDDVYYDLEDQIKNLKILKKQIQTEKTEYNKWLREEARDELYIEKIVNAIESSDKIEHLQVSKDAISLNSTTKGYILAFGDAHYGTGFSISDLNGDIINEYSPEIFEKRMKKLLEETIKYVKKERISELHVYDLGDDLDGILRASQLVKLRYGIVESTVYYAKFLANWLNALSSYVKVSFQMCNGNHTELRMLGQPKGTFASENLGFIIFEIIKILLKDNNRVNIKSNKTGMIYDNIAGLNVVGFHGEKKDLSQTLKDFSQIYNIDIDLLIAGHLHHFNGETVAIGKDVVRIPSIIGVDDFSMKLAKTSSPGALLMTLEKDNGRIIDYHIKL